MTTRPPHAHHPGAPRAEIELSLKQCSLPQLETMLRATQLRLGSPDERLGDVDYAQLIAHQINNLLTGQRVNEILRQLDETDRASRVKGIAADSDVSPAPVRPPYPLPPPV